MRHRRLSRHRRRVLIVVCALLIGGVTAAAGVSLLSGSSAPVRLYGGAILCPQDYPYMADQATHLVYPPNYPLLPRGRAISCFLSGAAAHQAGYRTAPVPRGYAQVGPIYLGPPPNAIARTCRDAGRLTHAVIYCPAMLPTPWVYPEVNYDCPTAECFAPLLSLSGSFPAPATFLGSEPGVGDVTVWAATAGQLRAFPYLVGCGYRNPAHRLGPARFRGLPAAWFRCAGPPATVMLGWRRGRESYGISADGPSDLARRLVSFIAAHVFAVAAAPGRRG